MSQLALLTFDGPAAILSLNRPDARNALSIELLDALHAKVDELRTRDDLTVLVLTGEGKAFCAGMDLKAVLSEPGLPLTLLSSLAEFTIKLRTLPQVTVAKVNGAAIGGGCGIACVCDIAVTHADSKMGFPEVDLGVCPAVVAPWLVRKIGAGPARRILLMGGLMFGQQALECGIVDHLAPSRDALEATTDELVQRLEVGGPSALRATKNLLNELDGSLDAALVRRGAELSAKVVADPETQRILRAKLGA
jgi:enoyl-CoA hydratase/carnithine racemase